MTRPNFAAPSRVIAVGLLASRQPVRAGDRVLTEAWRVNTVAPELVLRSAATGRPLCGSGSQPDPEPAVVTAAGLPADPERPGRLCPEHSLRQSRLEKRRGDFLQDILLTADMPAAEVESPDCVGWDYP
jgi:hypothetical protein